MIRFSDVPWVDFFHFPRWNGKYVCAMNSRHFATFLKLRVLGHVPKITAPAQ
jgi:hypothetical protein